MKERGWFILFFGGSIIILLGFGWAYFLAQSADWDYLATKWGRIVVWVYGFAALCSFFNLFSAKLRQFKSISLLGLISDIFAMICFFTAGRWEWSQQWDLVVEVSLIGALCFAIVGFFNLLSLIPDPEAWGRRERIE